jgi:hypothetical protein
MVDRRHGEWPFYSRGERRAGAADGEVGLPGSAGLRRRVIGAAEMAIRGLVVFSVLLAGLAVWAWPAQAASSGTGGALTCFAVDVSGSNMVASDGEPPSDPGPVFVRQQVVELYDEVIADLGEAGGQQVGVVTFGTSTGTELGPVAVADRAARSQLEAALPGALRPSQAEAAWTNWVAGVDGCSRMFQRSGATRGMVVVLTDGYPEGPAGGPGEQLAAISLTAEGLWDNGIAIQPVLYGAGADQQGPARQAISRLAAMGHGQLVLAATPLDMLRGTVGLASLATGIPLGGAEVPVNGSSTVPLDLPARVATAVLVVLRSSDEVAVSVAAPGGEVLSRLAAGAGGPGLVIPLTRPTPGIYQASAQGRGSVFAAELLRLDVVSASSTPRASVRTPPGPRGSGSSGGALRRGAPGWGLARELALGLGVLAAVILSGWLLASRRRPKGTLVVWWGSLYRILDPVELNKVMELEDLFQAGAGPAGWSIGWTRQFPTVIGPDGSAVQLVADETKTVDTAPPATFTWFPDGIDTSLAGEPPGRPASTVT